MTTKKRTNTWRLVNIDKNVDLTISAIAKYMRVSKNQVIIDLLKDAGFKVPSHDSYEFKGWNTSRINNFKKWMTEQEQLQDIITSE